MRWLRRPREFREARAGARRLELGWAVIYYKPGEELRVGVSVVRGLRAVRRNRMRRRLRELMRLSAGELPPGSYLVVGKPGALTEDFWSMRRELLGLFSSSELGPGGSSHR